MVLAGLEVRIVWIPRNVDERGVVGGESMPGVAPPAVKVPIQYLTSRAGMIGDRCNRLGFKLAFLYRRQCDFGGQ